MKKLKPITLQLTANAMIQSYRDLKVWQKSMDLVDAVYRVTQSFPKEQQYILTSQIQRSAISVPSNIAEGRGRHSENDFYYHLNIAQGSLSELETQLMLAQRFGFIDEMKLAELLRQSEEVIKMLHGLKNGIKPKKAKTYNLTANS